MPATTPSFRRMRNQCQLVQQAGNALNRAGQAIDGVMIYFAYQTQSDFLAPLRSVAGLAAASLGQFSGLPDNLYSRSLRAACEMVSRAGLTHERPPFRIERVKVGERELAVREEAALVTPFGTLLRFAKEEDLGQPRVLLVAPLSGHFATLLRDTVATLLPDHDVYITDWHNARDIPVRAGRFGLDEYIEHIMRFLEHLGSGAHVIGVCQPCVAVLAAVALMAQDGNPAQPRTMALMAGPIDCRLNPTKVNELATGKPLTWFESNLIATVPLGQGGAGRRVYPGFVQLGAFMSMNLSRHVRAHLDLYTALAQGRRQDAEATKTFYDEYFAVLDLPAEFYLETVGRVFQDFALARGELDFRGRRVEPKAIRRTALLTVEGEKDDICSVGQTLAAQDLCSGLWPNRKRHHLQAGVGHYGVFSGRRWQQQIYPIVRSHILAND